MFSTIRWVGSLALLLVFGISAVGNLCIAGLFVVRRARASMIPLVGGIAGAVGLLALPVDGAQKWWWLAPLVDLGCAPSLVAFAAVWLLRRGRRNGAPGGRNT